MRCLRDGAGSADAGCSPSGSRTLKKMDGSQDASQKTSEICLCANCGRRFVDRFGFEGIHFSDDVVLKAFRLSAKGLSSSKTSKEITEDVDILVHSRTIRRQAAKYLRLVEHFTRRLNVKIGGDTAIR